MVYNMLSFYKPVRTSERERERERRERKRETERKKGEIEREREREREISIRNFVRNSFKVIYFPQRDPKVNLYTN